MNNHFLDSPLRRLALWWKSIRFFRYYIIADCSDNSVTFSRALFDHIRRSNHDADHAKLFGFYIPASMCYAFMVNPDLGADTIMSDIQYNEKYRTIGYEALCPTVTRIFHDYGLPDCIKMRLSVLPCLTGDNKPYYIIQHPRL